MWTAAPEVAGICLHLFQSNQGLTGGIMCCALTAGERYDITYFGSDTILAGQTLIHGRRPAELFPRSEGLFHLAPIPLVMHQVEDLDRDRWHRQLIDDAVSAFSNNILEVPDFRHIHDLGVPPDQPPPDAWCERQTAAVGVWHACRQISIFHCKRTRSHDSGALSNRYCRALLEVEGIAKPEAHISEADSVLPIWRLQGLHNHERYGPPYPRHRWAAHTISMTARQT